MPLSEDRRKTLVSSRGLPWSRCSESDAEFFLQVYVVHLDMMRERYYILIEIRFGYLEIALMKCVDCDLAFSSSHLKRADRIHRLVWIERVIALFLAPS